MAKKLSEADIRAARTEKEYKRLAKAADTRMKRLEEAVKKGGKDANLLQYAYARAKYDLQQWQSDQQKKKGKTAKWEVKPKTQEELERRLADVKRFLLDETSKPKASSVSKAIYTIEEKYGVRLTESELINYFESGRADKFDSMYGSKTALRAIGYIKAASQKTVRNILKSLQDVQTFPDNVVRQKAIDMMKHHKYMVNRILE